LEEAISARQRLEDGEDFRELSTQLSQAPNAAAGGDLGYIQQGVLPEELDEVIFSLAEHEISAAVEGPAGFHVFQVTEIVPEGPAPRSEIVAEVRRELREATARRFTRECVDRLADEVGVRLYPEHLWFSYHGRYLEGDHGRK
jgi:parvulin-like peptidyl-prolyl isomerase